MGLFTFMKSIEYYKYVVGNGKEIYYKLDTLETFATFNPEQNHA